ncbi:MAG: Twitching motility protein PilT [Gemmatimonadetes bacterium]|nr:Twitching motility protein PilT [Gemmatimonadota bacterium]
MAPVRPGKQHEARELAGPRCGHTDPRDHARTPPRALAGAAWGDYSYDAGGALAGIASTRTMSSARHRRWSGGREGLPEAGRGGLPASVLAVVDLPNGLVLLVGPTGAGKSTSMTAPVNADEPRLKDPHRRGFRGVRVRRAGLCDLSWGVGGVDALPRRGGEGRSRDDPDVIVLGEIRRAGVLKEVLALPERPRRRGGHTGALAWPSWWRAERCAKSTRSRTRTSPSCAYRDAHGSMRTGRDAHGTTLSTLRPLIIEDAAHLKRSPSDHAHLPLRFLPRPGSRSIHIYGQDDLQVRQPSVASSPESRPTG